MTETGKRRCFVLMPFAEQYREVYEQVYVPVCRDNGIECWRVDEIARPGSITEDIVSGIVDADVVIADLTSRNPNVFYELGIAHSVGNKTIMTAQKREDVPFDIAAYRVIFYEQTIAGSKKLGKQLDAAMKELLRSLDQTNNPVQAALSSRSFLGVRRRTPVAKIADHAVLNPPIMRMLEAEGIVYVDQLPKLNLREVKAKYSLGKVSMEKLVWLLLKHDLYSDPADIKAFVREEKLKTVEPPPKTPTFFFR